MARNWIFAASGALLLLLAACDQSSTAPDNEVAAIALITPPPEAVIAGTPLEPQPVVELRTSSGEPARVAGIVVEASVSTGTLAGTTSTTTDAQGRAAFTNLVLNGEAGSLELRFTCCELPPATREVTLSLGSAIAPQSATNAEARAGTVMMPGPSVRVSDRQSRPIEGALVRFALAGFGSPPATSVATNAEGVAELPSLTFGDVAGTALLTATLEGTQAQVRFELRATVSGQVEVIDQGYPHVGAIDQGWIPPTIKVTDFGLPQGDVAVRFVNSSAVGTPVVVTARTDAAGITGDVRVPLNPAPGENLVDVYVVGYSPVPIRLRVWGAEHPPLLFSSNAPSNVVALEDEYGWTDVSTRVVDATGAPVSGLDVHLSKEGEAGEVEWWVFFGFAEGPYYPTDEGGFVYPRWRVPTPPGTYRVTLSSPYITEPVTFTAIREE